MVAGGALDQFFKKYHIICNMKCGSVGHCDFELSNAGLARYGQIAKAHHSCALGDVIEEGVKAVEFAHRKYFCTGQATTCFGLMGGARLPPSSSRKNSNSQAAMTCHPLPEKRSSTLVSAMRGSPQRSSHPRCA